MQVANWGNCPNALQFDARVVAKAGGEQQSRRAEVAVELQIKVAPEQSWPTNPKWPICSTLTMLAEMRRKIMLVDYGIKFTRKYKLPNSKYRNGSLLKKRYCAPSYSLQSDHSTIKVLNWIFSKKVKVSFWPKRYSLWCETEVFCPPTLRYQDETVRSIAWISTDDEEKKRLFGRIGDLEDLGGSRHSGSHLCSTQHTYNNHLTFSGQASCQVMIDHDRNDNSSKATH